MRRFLTRPQAKLPLATILLGGLAAAITVALLEWLDETTVIPMFLMAFASSCVVVFTLPDAPVSHPLNVIGGHVLSGAVGLVLAMVLPVTWWSLGLGVGIALILMAVLRITHPPAGGHPILIMTMAADGGVHWWFLLAPILTGSVVVVAMSLLLQALRARGKR